MKRCNRTTCTEINPQSLESFNKDSSKKDGLNPTCKSCSKKSWKNNYIKTIEHQKQRKKEYYKNNKEKCNKLTKDWQQKNKEQYKQLQRTWLANNRQEHNAKVREWRKNKRQKDPLFKLKLNLRERFSSYLKRKGYVKEDKVLSLIGCSVKELKKYIENQFEFGMTWENHGHSTWHIDHIIPLGSAKTKEEARALFHYTNLQPLWAEENQKKHAKLPQNYEQTR